jgi:hypothetical protein
MLRNVKVDVMKLLRNFPKDYKSSTKISVLEEDWVLQ